MCLVSRNNDGQVIGLDNTLDTIALIARQMNADAVTVSTDWIRVKFLGVQIDTDAGRENLPPAKNVMASSFTTPDNKSFTVVGVLIVAGMTMAVIGLVFVIARKRRSKTSQTPFEHQEFEDEVKSSSGSDTKPVEDEDGHDEQQDLWRDMLVMKTKTPYQKLLMSLVESTTLTWEDG